MFDLTNLQSHKQNTIISLVTVYRQNIQHLDKGIRRAILIIFCPCFIRNDLDYNFGSDIET